MTDLPRDRRAGRPDRLGHPRESALGVGPHDDLLAVRAPLGGDGEVGDGRQTDPALGDGEVVVDQLLRDLPVGRAPLERGRLDGAVAQRHRPQRGGREDVGSGHSPMVALT